MSPDAPVHAAADADERLAVALAHAGEDPFVGVVSATRTAVVITDPRQADNPLVFVNDSFCRLTGYVRDELIGRNCRFLQGPGTDPAAVAAIRAAVAAGRPLEIDLRNYRKDGTAFWNRLGIAPVFNAAHEVIYFFASQTDVTADRERADALTSDNASLTVEVAARLDAQRLSETRLRFATEAAMIGVWELTLPDLKLTATPTVNAVYGLPPGDPNHLDVRGLIHPDDAERVLGTLDRAIRTGEPYHLVYRITRGDGRVGWIDAHGEVDRGPDGTPVLLRGVAQDVTAQREADLGRELSEESLRLAAEAGEIGTWDLDLTTNTLTWSDRTRAMFGIAPGVPVGLDADFYPGLHPDDVAATAAAFTAALDPRVRATYDVEYRTIGRKDGVVRWVAAKGKGIFAGGVCVRAIGSVIDITAPRRDAARQAFVLALTDEIRALDDAHAILRTVAVRLGRELGVNRAGFGRVHDDATIVIDLPFAAGLPAVTGSFAMGAFGESPLAANRSGETVVIADRAPPPDAVPLVAGVRALVSVPLIRDGKLRATLLVQRATPGDWRADDVALIEAIAERTWDAVERARAEAAMRELNATLEQRVADSVAERDAIWRESRDMLLVIGLDGTIEAVNPAWTATLGYARDDLIGHNYVEFIVTDDLAASDIALASIPATPLRGFENRCRAADGTVHDLAWSAAEANGKIYCVARDVSADKAAARALEAAQDALRQAQKMEAVGQLTGGIAHDFNNMLAIVLGSLDLLARRLPADDARARRYVDAAADGARRAATLTQRLLAFSRRQPLQPEPVDVNRLVAGMSDLLRGSLGGGIQLETVLAGGVWTVCVDPNQLENVILNLAINARDAMGGDGRVTIETHNCHLDDRYVAAEIGVAAGQYVLVAVTDAGGGMPPDVVAKAFDPFFTTKGVGQGTGLGLSQVYGFVKQSDGHVKIYSEVGVGTTVKLYLPRLVGVSAIATAAAAATPVVGGDGGEVILVVEDEPGVRAVTVDALGDLGYRVVEADSAAPALAVLEARDDIALLFTDIVMPEVNGARLAEAARALRPGLKVLFTTGYTRNAVVHNGVVDAGVELIGKPFTIDALAAKVRSVLDVE